MRLSLVWREEDGVRLASTVWRAAPGMRMISSALVGGGIGPGRWVLNAQVSGSYARLDPAGHLNELAAALGLHGPGVGMLTAAAVDRTMRRSDEGVTASATVGLRVPTWAAAPADSADQELAPIEVMPVAVDQGAGLLDGGIPESSEAVASAQKAFVVPASAAERVAFRPGASAVPDAGSERTGATEAPGSTGWRPGTVNIVVGVPVALSDAALVNAVMTATEAKTQALLDAGYSCTGTASDAVCVAAPIPGAGRTEQFAGPRSPWGSRIARAVHSAVHAGALDYTEYLKSLRRRC